MIASHRLAVLVDSCLLPSVSGPRLPEWVLRGLERGTPGAAVHGDGPAARAAADALRSALPDALTARPDPALSAPPGVSAPQAVAPEASATYTEADRGAAAAAALVASGANLHLGVRPDPRPGATAAFVTELQSHGVAAALGPFTGAGDPRPFAEAAAAGVRAVTADVPAALEEPVVARVLRGELGYRGVVVSDTLDAPPIVAAWGVPGAAVLAWIAGVDLIRLGPGLGPGVREAVHAAAARAVADGDLRLARLEEAADRVARLRRWASEPRMPAVSG
ncbi:glycoside hydrolase family 3 N-terminal domain-containing protein [Actinacidiphila yeochonensis]|uniref:glycoside hydrolase family 3 N-terminal domain-containing protein n=1 Tax=Actinacidiphila yeochonensis TaxID=89050 RepID=UPI00055AC6F5|nr:glycoside hydrolase family 3 N-terminal domain-containing protein [Actinacidiphila yeochonensis]